MVNKIFLVGYMCSGKTTIGRLLAERLNYNFLDTDDTLPLGRQNRIDRDELYRVDKKEYHDIEAQILREILEKHKNENYVISTGGSTVGRDENKILMKSSGLVIYLKINPKTYCKRMENHRNMVYRFQWNNSKHENIVDAIERYFLNTENIRYKFADIKIDANGNIEDICSNIESWLIG